MFLPWHLVSFTSVSLHGTHLMIPRTHESSYTCVPQAAPTIPPVPCFTHIYTMEVTRDPLFGGSDPLFCTWGPLDWLKMHPRTNLFKSVNKTLRQLLLFTGNLICFNSQKYLHIYWPHKGQEQVLYSTHVFRCYVYYGYQGYIN